MKLLGLLCFALLVMIACSKEAAPKSAPQLDFDKAFQPVIFSSKNYLDEFFDIIETQSVNKDSINFDSLKQAAYAQTINAKTAKDCYPAIHFTLKVLGDKHSVLIEPELIKKWQTQTVGTDKDFIKRLNIQSKVINDSVAYISLPGIMSYDSTTLNAFADSLQLRIKSLDSPRITGWIVDLRENSGGNCWAMLAGIGPILGEGLCGYFVKKDNARSNWFYKNGVSGINGAGLTKVSLTPYKILNEKNSVAILTGPRTASSGEVVVIAFKGKKNTRFFGEATAGLSTSTSGGSLSDGAQILLTNAVDADRTGKLYGAKIIPDEMINFSDSEYSFKNDPVILKAIKWIDSRIENNL